MNSFYREFEATLGARGLTYGGGRINPEHELFYLNIPKNASGFLDRLFSDSGWTVANLNTMDTNKISCVIVLRDPVDRWISGVTQYLVTVMGHSVGQRFVDEYNHVVEQLLFDQVIFDDHTMPQYYFFDQVQYKFSNQYFLFDSTVTQRLRARFALSPATEFEANDSASDANKKIMIDFIRNRINNNKNLYQHIKSKYQQDYRIINSVQLQ